MPTYDYECTNCGHTFELMQSITAPAKRKPDAPCDGCGKKAPIRRLMGTGGAILFKGSGFYETDYRSEGYKKAAEAEKKQHADSGKGESSKSDSGTSDTGKKSSAKSESSKSSSSSSASGKSNSKD